MHVVSPRFGSRATRIVTALGLVAGALVFSAPPAGAISVERVSTGAVTACVLTSAGGVKCWGYNGEGELGDGTRQDRLQPVGVVGLDSGVSDVQAVWDHSCALLNSGGVRCWGHNGDGELGNGTHKMSTEPVRPTGLGGGGVTQISLGFDSGCALLTTTEVNCWGYNGNGQLGDSTRTTRLEPVYVQDGDPNNPNHLTGVVALAAGWDHTCALMNTGGVKCWGDNHSGELGDGTNKDRLEPVDVSGLSGVDAVTAGYNHTCALLGSGGLKCWGGNAKGQLGDGTSRDRTTPVAVNNLSSVASASAGYNHTCAVTLAGAAKCWGANSSGELGDGSTKNRFQPVGVYRAGSGVAQISAGGWKGAGLTCLTTTSGAVKCFGSNHGVSGLEPIVSHGGQIGDGTKRIDRHIPIAVRTLLGASPTKFQPDALISKSSSGTYAGNNVYNSSGANQKKKLAVNPGKTVKFFVRIANDSKAKDSFFLLGTGPGKGFSVGYSIGGKNIKTGVVAGTYWLTLSPGANKTVVVSVKAGSNLQSGAKRTFKVLARSAGNSAKVDAVKAIVKV
jgi:alpha-tubulin suppressor-like RCC1 family protein